MDKKDKFSYGQEGSAADSMHESFMNKAQVVSAVNMELAQRLATPVLTKDHITNMEICLGTNMLASLADLHRFFTDTDRIQYV